MKKHKTMHNRGKPTIRNKAAGHTFKKLYGQPKLTKEPVKSKCRVCNEGVLERRQWNMLNCTNINCNHKELQLA